MQCSPRVSPGRMPISLHNPALMGLLVLFFGLGFSIGTPPPGIFLLTPLINKPYLNMKQKHLSLSYEKNLQKIMQKNILKQQGF